ncbi:hypothetical protein V2P20_17520 [Methylobacter sp. Wu1]|uniref:hypothetical protein n=1 Tax=Methylobacter sp. Wu1 TaxID=3119359 RepID=UPI002F92B0C5
MMLKKFIAKIADLFLGLLVGIYIVLEELVWDKIAEPVYNFIHGLKILQKVEAMISRLDRHALLVIFLALFTQVELLGIVALKLMATGQIISGTLLYAGKIPIAAFTFWLFNISKQQLMTFGWFRQLYELVELAIHKIKSSAIHRHIIARLKSVKEWLKNRLSGPRLFVRKLMEKLRSSDHFRKSNG